MNHKIDEQAVAVATSEKVAATDGVVAARAELDAAADVFSRRAALLRCIEAERVERVAARKLMAALGHDIFARFPGHDA